MPEPAGQSTVQLGQIDAAYLDTAAERGQLYVLIDGCAVPGLPALGKAAGATCLYRGEAERTHGAQAPWLFPVGPGGRATFVERLGTGDWGCFLVSPAPPPRLVRHLRSLLEVRSPAGEKWLFRFWDPRVLPTFLPASGPIELNAFFGPIESFAVTGAEGNAFAAWRAPEIVGPPPCRAVGERLAITPAQLAAEDRYDRGEKIGEWRYWPAAPPAAAKGAYLSRQHSAFAGMKRQPFHGPAVTVAMISCPSLDSDERFTPPRPNISDMWTNPFTPCRDFAGGRNRRAPTRVVKLAHEIAIVSSAFEHQFQ